MTEQNTNRREGLRALAREQQRIGDQQLQAAELERPVPIPALTTDVPDNWDQIKQVSVLLAHIADPDSTVTVTEFAQAEAVITYLRSSLPTREQIATVYACAVSSQLSPGEFLDALDVLGVPIADDALLNGADR